MADGQDQEPQQAVESAFSRGDVGSREAGSSEAASGASSTDALPQSATDAVNGSSDVAGDAERKTAEDAQKNNDDAFDTAKKTVKDFKGLSKLKPGFGGLTDALDVVDKVKDTIASVKEGDAGGAVSNGIEAGGGAVKALAPALAKIAPSVASGALGVAAPIATGAVAGAGIVKAGENESRQNDTLQREFKMSGLANADGSPTSIIDSVRNQGDQVTAALGGGTFGKVVGTGTKILGSVATAPLQIGSAAVGAGKSIYGKAKNLLGFGDG